MYNCFVKLIVTGLVSMFSLEFNVCAELYRDSPIGVFERTRKRIQHEAIELENRNSIPENDNNVKESSALEILAIKKPPIKDPIPKTNETKLVYFLHVVDTETSSRIIESGYNIDILPKIRGYRTDANSLLKSVMNVSSREGRLDSFGTPYRYTWYVLAMEKYCVSNDADCNIIYSALVDGIPGNPSFEGWKHDIEKYKDDIEFHYHHLEWSDLDGDGISHWNQLVTFNETNQHYIRKMLNHLLIDKNFFPSSYRAGWGWEDNGLSGFLEEWIQFDLTNLAPFSFSWNGIEPRWNVADWGRAPIIYRFYHPDTNDYQSLGDMNRIILRSRGAYTQEEINEVFKKVITDSESQFLCFYTHTGGSLLSPTIHSYLTKASSETKVSFKFATADEVARIFLNSQDTSKPQINIVENNNLLTISSDEEIYQDEPYVAIRYENGTYGNLKKLNRAVYFDLIKIEECDSEKKWFYDLSPFNNTEFTLGIAVTDKSGNVATKIYRRFSKDD